MLKGLVQNEVQIKLFLCELLMSFSIPGGGGYSDLVWMGVCHSSFKTLKPNYKGHFGRKESIFRELSQNKGHFSQHGEHSKILEKSALALGIFFG